MIFNENKRDIYYNKLGEYSIYNVLKYLFQKLEVKVSNKGLKEALDEQRDSKGSIIGIKEVLNKFEVESKIYRLEYNDLLGIDCPFLAHIEDNFVPKFVVITEISSDAISYFDSVKEHKTESVTYFLSKWSGVILVPLTSQESGEPEYEKIKLEENREDLLKIGFVFLVLLCLFLIIYRIDNLYNDHFVFWFAFFMNKALGFIVSLLIVKIEYGNTNSLIRRICINSECEKVLHSKGSKLFSWLSMGDIGLIYFFGGLFLLSIINSPMLPILNILIILNMTTLPFTLYSAYYQYKIAKAFCPFCCTVIIVLWIEFIIGLLHGFNFSSIDLITIIFVSTCYIIISLNWFVFRPFLAKAYFTDKAKAIITRIKKDVDLFESIIKNKKSVTELKINNEITIGEIYAPHTLIVVISPSCDSCGQLFSEIKSFMQPSLCGLKVIFRFKGVDAEKKDINKVIDWIISLNISGESKRALELYENWSLFKLEGLKKWEEKNHLTSSMILNEAMQIRLKYNSWINSIDIPGVPILIFDGKILPMYYTFSDIKYLIKKINGKKLL